MKHTIKQDNYNINILTTKKFKSTRIHVSFGNDLTEESVTKRALIPYLLRAMTKKYNSRNKISTHLDNLYAAQFSVGTSKIGLSHFVNFDISIINDKYTIDKESLFIEAVDFLKEVILNPLFSQEIFVQEKRLLEEYFLSIYANKMRYAIKELQTIMFEDEAYKISPLGIEEQVNELSLQDAIDAYNHMIDFDKITISVVGDVNKDNVVDIINTSLKLPDRNKKIVMFELNPKTQIDSKNETIIQDVVQAKLAMGYRFDVRYLDKDYYPAIVFNSLLGGSSDSLLHTTIREQQGLVYFISSSYDFYKGVLFVFSGINASEYENTMIEVDNIIKSVQNGEFDPAFLEMSKKTIINNIIESRDSNYNLAVRLERKDLFNKDVPLEESIANINKVTLQDIMNVAKKVLFDTSVLLRGESNE